MSENGEEKYARLSGKEMYDDIDKLRRENGWKPRRRGSTKSSAKVRENATASPAAPHTQAATPAAAAVGNSLQQQQQQSTMVKNSSKQSDFSSNVLGSSTISTCRISNSICFDFLNCACLYKSNNKNWHSKFITSKSMSYQGQDSSIFN